MMINLPQQRLAIGVVAAAVFAFFGTPMAPAQQLDATSVIQQVDAAVRARIENLVGYTVTEHYAVYRGADEIHPVAEMTVNTTYRKDSGKSYAIVSQTGSEIVRNLENEKHINQPSIREGAWITSTNYDMRLQPGGIQPLDGRDCLVLTLSPKRKESYLLQGLLWVNAKDGSIVQVQGTASKNSSLLTGPTQIMRQYTSLSGFPEATHVRAVSKSFMLGQTIVKIDYQNYQIQLRPPL
jgi:hypothetical protein